MKKYLFFLFLSNLIIQGSYSQIPVVFGVTPGGGGNGFEIFLGSIEMAQAFKKF